MHGLYAFGLTSLVTQHGAQHTLSGGRSAVSGVSAVVQPFEAAECGRRDAFKALFMGGSVLVASPLLANALDMDAFMNAELESDKKNCDPKRDPKCIPKLTSDEALCKYGQSGNARSDACKRAKEGGAEMPDTSKQGKSLGGAYAM